jgi:hypothetical protein
MVQNRRRVYRLLARKKAISEPYRLLSGIENWETYEVIPKADPVPPRREILVTTSQDWNGVNKIWGPWPDSQADRLD